MKSSMQCYTGNDWEWMIFHLLAAAPLALCSPVAKAAANPWLRGWSCSQHLQEQINSENWWGAAAPRAREDGDTGAGSTG